MATDREYLATEDTFGAGYVQRRARIRLVSQLDVIATQGGTLTSILTHNGQHWAYWSVPGVGGKYAVVADLMRPGRWN